jgi:spore photoproduct lyase
MSERSFLNKPFSHVYIELDIKDHPVTKEVLGNLSDPTIIYIKHYKDVFNRKRQDFRVQSNSRSLILARNTGNLIFEGSDMCQDHGNSRFFYATSVMNCLFDCDYCFLKGMYSTGNIVLFVNLEDYEKQVEEMLHEGPMYLSVSYDTDLLALQGIADLSSFWIDLAKKNKDLTVEFRTKAHVTNFEAVPNVIYSFTLSPQSVISSYEHHTASLKGRIDSVRRACDLGCNVRLCFDPVLYVRDHMKCYNDFMDEVIPQICWEKITDVSVGAFRISKEYMKGLRSCCPMSAVTEFPYVNEEGYMKMPRDIYAGMRELLVSRLKEVKDEGKIFCDSDGSVVRDR